MTPAGSPLYCERCAERFTPDDDRIQVLNIRHGTYEAPRVWFHDTYWDTVALSTRWYRLPVDPDPTTDG